MSRHCPIPGHELHALETHHSRVDMKDEIDSTNSCLCGVLAGAIAGVDDGLAHEARHVLHSSLLGVSENHYVAIPTHATVSGLSS
jgi:hypothetical protein